VQRAFEPNVHARITKATVPPGFTRLLSSRAGKAVVNFAGSQLRISYLHQLEIESVIALAIMAIISAVLRKGHASIVRAEREAAQASYDAEHGDNPAASGESQSVRHIWCAKRAVPLDAPRVAVR
jgi:hypothetical protein